jgi:hypothetical protein
LIGVNVQIVKTNMHIQLSFSQDPNNNIIYMHTSRRIQTYLVTIKWGELKSDCFWNMVWLKSTTSKICSLRVDQSKNQVPDHLDLLRDRFQLRTTDFDRHRQCPLHQEAGLN